MNELKVGFLTLLAIASVVAVSLKISSDKSAFGEYIHYQTILSDASGIYENSSIKVAGINAGYIESVSLSGSKALVSFKVLRQIKVTKFSRLRIKSVGFLGDKFIDIYLGDPEAERLAENSMVSAESGAGFEQLGKDASEILKDVKVIAKVIRESLYTEDKQNAIQQIVSNINEFSKNANDLSKSLKRLVEGNESTLNETIENLRKVSAQLAFETDQYSEGSLMNDLSGIEPILAKVDDAVSDLKVVMSDMRAGRGTVGKLLRDEAVIDKVNETLSGVNKIVGRVNRYKTDLALYTGANNIEGSKTELDIDLIPGPERFFRFGVVTGDGTRLEKKVFTTTIVDDGDPVVEERLEVEESGYRFNLQLGRRINQLALRVGLFESTGGFGVDYHIPTISNISSLEVFDYRDDIGANLKFSTQLRIWNVFYTKLSAEDISRNSKYHVYTFSAGLNFNDEDLASLIGLAL